MLKLDPVPFRISAPKLLRLNAFISVSLKNFIKIKGKIHIFKKITSIDSAYGRLSINVCFITEFTMSTIEFRVILSGLRISKMI